MGDFGKIGFSGKLRPSQIASSNIIQKQLESGEKNLHIVAPPGSGKTVLGLYTWSDLVRKPTLVLCPNSAIQAQWIARAKELFNLDGKDNQIGTDTKTPGLLTSLTYQSITLPKRGDKNLDDSAIELWMNQLLTENEVDDLDSSMVWINGLKKSNLIYYNERLSYYRKKIRDNLAIDGNALGILHESSKKNLQNLSNLDIGLIILDECHHLLGHWGRVLSEIRKYFGNPIVLGLTATPPDLNSVNIKDGKRYQEFFGEIDYEVPVPALVRNSNLSPYQDLAYFVRPSNDELIYISNVDREFEELIYDISNGKSKSKDRIPKLDVWLSEVLEGLILPSGAAKNWSNFVRRDETLANHSRLYLYSKGKSLPKGIPKLEQKLLDLNLKKNSLVIPLLDRYIRNGLLRSKNTLDHNVAEKAKQRLRMLGYQITETGIRPCASPVGRVMAYASSKYDALNEILSAEMQALGPDIRAVVVTDFEKTSATSVVEDVLNKDAGGAIAAFRSLLENESTDRLNPVLMTGSTVLVDDDLIKNILPKFEDWVNVRRLDIGFEIADNLGFKEIKGKGGHWKPRYYTEMITEMFQQGLTKCLVGTRGLLGEGWDASKINVLIDLTTVTTSMSINQLRGRSFRLDKDNPNKVANNWDIVCLAEEFTQGFEDYDRFKRKHSQLYGVCDDSAIEKGVGHVHAAFTDARPEGISETMDVFNEEMIHRAKNRGRTIELWKIGESFDEIPSEALELKMNEGFSEGWPILSMAFEQPEWNDESLISAIATAVSGALRRTGYLKRGLTVASGDRGGGWMRAYLEGASEEESKIFITALGEVLGPLDNPRYMIPRDVKIFYDTWISKLLPNVFGKYFRIKRSKLSMYHAVPKILSQNKNDAKIFEKYWNFNVSPGVVIYGYSEKGRIKVRSALENNLSPRGSFHTKSIFT
ncbi:MAG: DEAD/DEAH box helicase family protein [Euryarchaeota archaeon]|nr:DEAD/DEAH box helicase family protein [Euryarchaeota archaeon]